MASSPCASPVHSGAVPPRRATSEDGARPASVCSTSSWATVVQLDHRPAALLVRSCTETPVTPSSRAHVTPTEENRFVSGRETVSAGMPAVSFPDAATSSEIAGLAVGPGSPGGGGVDRRVGAGVHDRTVGGHDSGILGALDEPRSTADTDGATGLAAGSGAAYTGRTRNVPVMARKAARPPRMRRKG